MSKRERKRESENEHENNLAILSSIDPIATTSTSTGDSECVSKYVFSKEREEARVRNARENHERVERERKRDKRKIERGRECSMRRQEG